MITHTVCFCGELRKNAISSYSSYLHTPGTIIVEQMFSKSLFGFAPSFVHRLTATTKDVCGQVESNIGIYKNMMLNMVKAIMPYTNSAL